MKMNRKLIDYLPPMLREVMEYMAITGAQQPEIEDAWDALNLVMNNQFIDTATEDGVAVWESELNITPLTTDTLDERKDRIKTFWIYGVVYTYNWLVEWLKSSCGDKRTLPPTVSDYTLRVALPISVDYIGLLESMRRYISANILIDPLILITPPTFALYTGAAFYVGIKQTITTEAWDMDNINLLADEAGAVLMESADNLVLFEEVTT